MEGKMKKADNPMKTEIPHPPPNKKMLLIPQQHATCLRWIVRHAFLFKKQNIKAWTMKLDREQEFMANFSSQ